MHYFNVVNVFLMMFCVSQILTVLFYLKFWDSPYFEGQTRSAINAAGLDVVACIATLVFMALLYSTRDDGFHVFGSHPTAFVLIVGFILVLSIICDIAYAVHKYQNAQRHSETLVG